MLKYYMTVALRQFAKTLNLFFTYLEREDLNWRRYDEPLSIYSKFVGIAI